MSQDELLRVVSHIHYYLSEEQTTKLLITLDEEVGKKSQDQSTKQFLGALRGIVDKPPPAPLWLWGVFYSLVTVHILIVVGVIGSFFVIPVKILTGTAPWYLAIPVMTFIWFFSTTRVDCQLTNMENGLRNRLGLKKIGGFVGHYFLRPAKAIFGKRRLKKKLPPS